MKKMIPHENASPLQSLPNYAVDWAPLMLRNGGGVVTRPVIGFVGWGTLLTAVTSNEQRRVMRFEVFATVKIKVDVFRHVTPFNAVVGYQSFGGPCCLKNGGNVVLQNNITRRHNPEDLDLSTGLPKATLKFYLTYTFCILEYLH
jgi:hypothetical protein